MTEERKIEYMYKNSVFVLPPRTKLYLSANKVYAEIDGKTVTDISPYQAKQKFVSRAYTYKIGFPVTSRGSQLIKEYAVILDFFKKNNRLDLLNLDHAVSHSLPLCTFFRQSDLVRDDNIIARLIKEIPYLINIFTRPLIHLKEADVTLPVDMVRRIDRDTVNHLSVRTENWDGFSYGSVVPKRLLTKIYEDDYGIYENIVFRDLIDKLITFLKKRIYNLTEVLDVFNKSVQLDSLTRLNHQSYYLALGKLYLGFSKMETSDEVDEMLEKTVSVYRLLTKYKTRDVYRKNANVKPITGKIKKTNILHMHKDYKHVYALHHMLNDETVSGTDAANADMQLQAEKGYGLFAKILTLFAVTHFNMDCDATRVLYEDGQINGEFFFKGWTLNTKSDYNPILGFDAISFAASKNGRTIKYLLIPMAYRFFADKKRQYEHIIGRLDYCGDIYDKYVFLEPFDFDDTYGYHFRAAGSSLTYSVLPVSISEINSFRRLQKLLLECMVTADINPSDCPFCGERLFGGGTKYLCPKCRTAIIPITCRHCKQPFNASFIDTAGVRYARQASAQAKRKKTGARDTPLFYQKEKSYLFRNSVEITDGGYICPFCGGQNK